MSYCKNCKLIFEGSAELCDSGNQQKKNPYNPLVKYGTKTDIKPISEVALIQSESTSITSHCTTSSDITTTSSPYKVILAGSSGKFELI